MVGKYQLTYNLGGLGCSLELTLSKGPNICLSVYFIPQKKRPSSPEKIARDEFTAFWSPILT